MTNGNYPGPWHLAEELQASHFTWVALHVHNGLNGIGIDPLWVSALREHGLLVGGWGTEEQHPLIDAVLADLAVRANDLDFYIADAEAPYEANHGGGWRSKTFVAAFRSLQPTLPAALTTYGGAPAPWVLPIDYPASKYVPLLQQAGARGFSVFLGDQATAADYAALASLLAPGG